MMVVGDNLSGRPEAGFISVFDLFKIGIGPSSSHTMGPMLSAWRFAIDLAQSRAIESVDYVQVELFGSLAATGRGHATDKAVIAGLAGLHPEIANPDVVVAVCETALEQRSIALAGVRHIDFDPATNIVFRQEHLPGHPNALRITALASDALVSERCFFSIGGGFIREEGAASACTQPPVPFPFRSAAELLDICSRIGASIAGVVRANEAVCRSDAEIDAKLDVIWTAMQGCVARGLDGRGVLPGGLNVRRRAAELNSRLAARNNDDPLHALDWVSLYALAVNEENAAGGRVVTAPTNGAAGIVPAVLHYYERFVSDASAAGIRTFLLTAAAIGAIIKQNASISGAEMGCQGEVGSAAAMAAAGLTAALGGSPPHIENAAEIALEHSLGLTCDPVGGLVQIPCIERNAIAAIKAIGAARLALNGDGTHRVSLDQAIMALREIGRDMHSKYRETALGGLAVAVPAC